VIEPRPQIHGAHSSAAWRAAAFVALTLIETVLGSSLYGIPLGADRWTNPVCYTNLLSFILLLAGIAFPLIAWPRRREFVQGWARAARPDGLGGSGILVNIALFVLLLTSRAKLSELEPQAIPALWYWGYSALLLATGASLALVAAPISFWRDLARSARAELALALCAACLVVIASLVSQESWSALSYATLVVSHWMLGLYENNVFVDFQSRMLGAEGFSVEILPACSGYEGIGLIIAFLAIYLWVFRAHLRFPNALFLFPIGIAAIWLLNSVRITSLVSIGAHISPTVALNGFHSWSGWIAFLIVTVGTMAATRNSAFLWATSSANVGGGVKVQVQDDLVAAYLAPFAAFMASSIVASAFVPAEHWLYGLKVVAIGATLVWFRGAYAGLAARASPLAVAAGLAVGIAWIASDPQRGAESPLGAWIAGLPVWLVLIWLTMRALGAVVLVPIVEELAFRGYLCRTISEWRVPALGGAQMRLLAILASSLAFAILHDRWIAAAASGVVFATLMYRSGRLADPIAAHMAANATIVAWSVSAQDWALL
jgi:exosortase E/protease (VPEID-CTERM system)